MAIAQQIASNLDYDFHGTTRITANLAQGQLFTWNKEGITNNLPFGLFVICPMMVDTAVLRSIQLLNPNTVFVTTISIFLPSSVPIGTAISCFIRFSNSSTTGGAVNDSQNAITNVTFSPGTKSLAGGRIVAMTSGQFTIGPAANNLTLTGAHILCLLPGGATLRGYDFQMF